MKFGIFSISTGERRISSINSMNHSKPGVAVAVGCRYQTTRMNHLVADNAVQVGGKDQVQEL